MNIFITPTSAPRSTQYVIKREIHSANRFNAGVVKTTDHNSGQTVSNVEITSNRFSYSNPHETITGNLVYEAYVHDYELPNDEVISTTLQILGIFSRLKIKLSSCTPLSEGGVGIEFTHNSKYYNIKVDNELDGVFYKEEAGKLPHGWDLNFPSLLHKIKIEFDGL